eukprot:1175821-Prorocentrum_minimum.AAC.1
MNKKRMGGPKGRAVGESGELDDTGREKGKGLWGVESTLAVIGTGGPESTRRRPEGVQGRGGGRGRHTRWRQKGREEGEEGEVNARRQQEGREEGEATTRSIQWRTVKTIIVKTIIAMSTRARHGHKWEGQVYMDLRMPFGNSGAPAAFDRITQAIVRHMKASGYPAFVGYLDDFFLIAHRKKGENPTTGE